MHRLSVVCLTWILLVVLGGASVLLWSGSTADTPVPIGLTLEFAWPEYSPVLAVADSDWDRFIRAARATLLVPHAAENLDTASVYWRLTLTDTSQRRQTWFITRDLRLYDPSDQGFLSHPDLKAFLARWTHRLHQRFFGQPLTWPEVAPMFPVGGKAQIRDLETGLSFWVYRHRGDSHADVEPLTENDTGVLRTIYGGSYSWKRRAVVVTIGTTQVAASINGMPHGWGDLFENSFRGHFCVHFRGSRVHTTWRPDVGHQMMVLKAAGQLVDALDAAAPQTLAEYASALGN